METQTPYNPETHEEHKTTAELIEDYTKELTEFFGSEPITDVEVVEFPNQEQIINFYNKNSKDEKNAPSYLVGFSPENHIYIVGPEGMPPTKTESGPDRFRKVLKHELAHKYLKNFCNNNTPSWLLEGVCLHVAGQMADSVPRENLTIGLLDSLSRTQDGAKYSVGKAMVDMIVAEHGKEALLELVGMPTQEERNNRLQTMFPWLKN